ncbi:MAG: hypothetical protein WAZ48_00430 [Lysobacteraceae bacterium]
MTPSNTHGMCQPASRLKNLLFQWLKHHAMKSAAIFTATLAALNQFECQYGSWQ